ncbi:MAG: MFS transporter [Deltaproteobacteria bacterium]|nr:MFS transporter [Deltaproteobacteria bacterium]
MKRNSFFYGYYIIVACAGIQAIGVGTYVAFGVFFKPLLEEFTWSRGILSGAHSLAFLIAGGLGILVGRLVDRFGPRFLMTVAGLFFGSSLLLFSTIHAPWQLYLFYSLFFGMGLSAVDVIALNTTARWFVRRRGVMTGIVKMGTGFGQMLIPFLANVLIAGLGWRQAYAIIGGVGMMLLVLIAQVLRHDPFRMGLFPDNSRAETSGSGFREREIPLWKVMSGRAFWMIFFANLSACFCLMSIMVHIVPHAIDMGISPHASAMILSTIGGASILGRFSIGSAIDRIGNRRSMILCFILLILMLLWLQLSDELWMFYLFAVIYGFAHGGLFTVISPIVAEYFGIRSHGLLFGVAVFAGTVGGFIGPIFAGSLFDITGSYRIAFWGYVIVAIIGLGLIFSLRPYALGRSHREDKEGAGD